MKYWQRVRADLRVSPVVEGMVWSENPVCVERYFFRGIDRLVKGVDGIALVVQLGGMRVREGAAGQWRGEFLPGRCLLIPPNCDTHWHYSGPVDFAVFYFPVHVEGLLDGLRRLALASQEPLAFSDSLATASAQALTDELHKGPAVDERFMGLLANVVLEQTYRMLTAPSTHHISPQHVHFERMNGVLKFIREHLADTLSLEVLATQAKLSIPHFRRIFQEAMGISVHKFVLVARIEQARKFLETTRMPLSRIADECGFSSQSHLTTSFRSAHAATPTEFRSRIARSPVSNKAG